MKNKTKKILAGACLGLVGMGCLTGCSMTDEQKKALDLITDKADEIVNLLEDNMEFNNKNLSKAEAAEKILLGRNKFKFASFDQVEISMLQNTYYGMFEELESAYTDDEDTPWRMLYRKNGDEKVCATVVGDEWDNIEISNFETDKHLSWNKGNTSFENREYDSEDFTFDIFDLNLTQFVGPVITPELIKDVKTTEQGYEFYIFTTTADEIECESKMYVSFDGYITKWEMKALEFDDSIGGDLTSTYVEFNFKYNNVDFSALDQKIAELNKN